MKLHRGSLFAVLSVVAIWVVSAGLAHAAKPAKTAGKPVAAGVVSKLDTTAKTFVVTNKKKGDTTVSFDDKTVFKKAAAAGDTATAAVMSVSDLKDGMRVMVQGKLDGNKVQATQVMFRGKGKKKKGAAE